MNSAEHGKRIPRSAWMEVDLAALAGNFRILRAALPPTAGLIFVVKDDGYGMGAEAASRTALDHGATQLAVFTLEEAARLRDAGFTAPILLLGERLPSEVSWVDTLDLEPCVGRIELAREFAALGRRRRRPVPVHLKINTGMNRFGFPWRTSAVWSRELADETGLIYAGALSHFAQSDEADKTFARVQLGRFESCLESLRASGIRPSIIHHSNSGAYLDLPEARFDAVRIGLLAQGIHPSPACRQSPGLRPVLSMKARVVAVQDLDPGDTVGYGMRWRADRHSRIGVLPVGYGDGVPRLRNSGEVLLREHRVPIVGGVTMDALMVDLTSVPDATVGDEAVLLGRQGHHEITLQDLASLAGTVSYEILVGLNVRLPRVYLGRTGPDLSTE